MELPDRVKTEVKMNYPNLSAEMSRNGYTVSDLASAWGTTERTARNRINGITDITFAQCKQLRDALFSGLSLDYLFDTEPRP